jgi:hypothetical protein
MDNLLRFLPLFDVPGRAFVVEWKGGGGHVPYPKYPEDVLEFFRLAGMPPWADLDYNPGEAARMLEDDAFIQRATLAEIRTMLTYCVRAERFGDGFWEHVLERGKIVLLLKRLQALRDQT